MFLVPANVSYFIFFYLVGGAVEMISIDPPHFIEIAPLSPAFFRLDDDL
jgi:hypothetical protein